MSKKKKKPSESVAVETAVEKDEQDEAGKADAVLAEVRLSREAKGQQDEAAETKAESHASEAHGDGDHGHGGHDPVEDDRPRVGLIAVITLISCVTMLVLCIFVRELFNIWGQEELQTKVLSVQSEQLKTLRATEKQKLSKYQWVSQKDGVLRIPTDRAIDLTIAAYRAPPPAPAPTPTMQAPTPKPEEIKPEDKPDDNKKGDDGKKDEKGTKDEKKKAGGK